jgi:mannose-1-phosphate guanylyltransferase
MNIILMCGGGGTRLWPLSRKNKPKQFIDFGSGKTLIQHAYERALALTGQEKIFVATAADYEQDIRKLLPDIPKERIFLEPEKRDTTAAFASIAARLVSAGAGDETALFMWSDHVFTNEPEFLNDLGKIDKIVQASPGAMVLLAHNPVSPETTLGYVEVGDNAAGFTDAYQVKCFREKPDLATAEKFVAAGNFYWNMGYFSLRPNFLLSELKRLAPEFTPHIKTLTSALEKNDATGADMAYKDFPKISIEYTLIEKLDHIIAITGDYGWNDVGNWAAVQSVFGVNGDHMPKGHHIHVDSQDNYVYNATDKAVSMIGVKDTIAVITDDAILITSKKDAAKVKEIVSKLEEDGATHLL